MMGRKAESLVQEGTPRCNGKFKLICWVSSVAWIGKAARISFTRQNQSFRIYSRFQLSSDRTAHHRGVAAGRRLVERFTVERRRSRISLKPIASGSLHPHADATCTRRTLVPQRYAQAARPIPFMCAAPLIRRRQSKAAVSQGVFRALPGEGCFGLVAVNDHGDRIDVAFSGRNHKNEEKISLLFSVPASSSALTASERTGL